MEKINIEEYMNAKEIVKFKMLFAVGLTLLFVSLFLNWYSVQCFDNAMALIGNWEYNLFTEWSNNVTSNKVLVEWLKPLDLRVPLFLQWLFIGILVICAYGAAFKDLESSNQIKNLLPYAYCNISLLVFNCFYAFIFPVMYLFPNNLYFPFLFYRDGMLKISISYSIGIGYCLQIIGFVLIFPYSVFYYKTISKFETKNNSAESLVKNQFQIASKSLNLDKYIAEEEIKKKIIDLNIKENIKVKRKK